VEARFWEPIEDGRARCGLCPHRCTLDEGGAGRCRVRRVEGGRLNAAGYGLVSSAHVDPIEKKPLYHFHPGAAIFSIGGWGCNLACEFCQNWSISQQADFSGRRLQPEEVVRAAERSGSIGIAYTYNEPITGCEFVLDCAAAARKRGLVNVMVTNGFVEPGPAAALLEVIDAVNVDVKSMDDEFYRRHCGAWRDPVLRFCEQAVAAGRHLEITSLVIPGLNDSDAGFRALADWMRERLGAAVPLHLSGYRPAFRARHPATGAALLEHARELALKSLDYVYLGNVRTAAGQDTRCPGCGAELIGRAGYRVRAGKLREGRCGDCGCETGIVTAAG
jgi:pyruvate formate lyase activating enzyme